MRGLRSFGLLGIYVGSQAVALFLALPFKSAGLASNTNPTSAASPLPILAAVIIAPLFILFFARRGGLGAIRGFLLLAIAGALQLTLSATFALFLPAPFFLPPPGAGQVGDLALVAAWVVAVTLFLALLIEPQWYVVDLVGFLAAGGIIAILGISFAILPVFILLIALAIYDAIAVYRTKHMVSLADIVTELKLPILVVMPSASGYDYTAAPTLKEQRARPPEEREAVFMGLGDVVIPGALIASAFVWLPARAIAFGLGTNLLVAIGAMVGSLLGYALLMSLVARGNPQAGLPFLNGGAIGGYLATYFLVFHSTGFGLTGSL